LGKFDKVIANERLSEKLNGVQEEMDVAIQ
jgi:hypothetical protein